MPASLFVATPTAGGIALAPYVASLVCMLGRLTAAGIGTHYRTCDGTDLISQRNLLVRDFLASGATHLLFVDSDMTFPPDLVLRLLGAGKPLVGIVYPKRRLDLARVARLVGSHTPEDAVALAYEWNLQPRPDGITVVDGLARVQALPGGFLLIARAVFDTMAERGDVPVVRNGRSAGLQGFFREMADGDVIHDLDYAFCRRWSATGGEVWAYVDADVRHVGDFRGAVRFGARLSSTDPAAVAE